MKKLFVTFFTILFCLTLSLSSGAEFQKGLTAYQQGNFVTAFSEFKPLAEQGDTSAAFNIAQLYRTGKGVLRDYKKAVKWFRVAAEKNHLESQYSLALMYKEGQGVIKNNKIYILWLSMAAGGGHTNAQQI